MKDKIFIQDSQKKKEKKKKELTSQLISMENNDFNPKLSKENMAKNKSTV